MTRPSHTADDDAMAEAAAEWIVRLSADDPTERDAARTGFDAWKAADTRHAAAAAGMERFVDRARNFQLGAQTDATDRAAGVEQGEADSASAHPSAQSDRAARAARQALGAVLDLSAERRSTPDGEPAGPKSPARRLGGLMALTCAVVLPAALALRAYPPAELLADLRTATGEQRSTVLADGSRLTLSSASAVDVQLSADQRRVQLLKGEILVDVAADSARPFVVETAHGGIRALGTRFIVRREAGFTLLTMLESRTAARAAESAAETAEIVVEAGQQARLTPQRVERLGAVNAGAVEDAFKLRRLVVQNRPLPEVLDELARHRPGLLRYEREAIEGIRVSAVLPLDDTDRALQLLATSFPQLRVRTVTPWVVMVDARP